MTLAILVIDTGIVFVKFLFIYSKKAVYFSTFTNNALTKVLLIKTKLKIQKNKNTPSALCLLPQHYPQVISSIALSQILSADSYASIKIIYFAL